MVISDLDYLEPITEEQNVIGGIVNRKVEEKLTFVERIDIDKKVKSNVDVKGNFAFVEGDAEAYGKNSLTQVLFTTYAEEGYGSASTGTGMSAAGGY